MRVPEMPYRDERKTTRFVDFAPMVFQEIRSTFGIHEVSDERLRRHFEDK